MSDKDRHIEAHRKRDALHEFALTQTETVRERETHTDAPTHIDT